MITANKLYLCSDENTLLDPNYRYVVGMPIFRKVSSKGKMITIFENSKQFAEQFAEQLEFDEAILIRIIATKLSCQTGIDKNSGLHFFKGDFPNGQMTDIICGFIRNYLLCKQCDRPEVVLKIDKTKLKLKHKCNACGASYNLDERLVADKIYTLLLRYT